MNHVLPTFVTLICKNGSKSSRLTLWASLMAVEISTTYIAASANRFHHVAHCSPSSLVAFGSSKVIAVWDTLDPYERGVLETLPGHEGLVTCVRFIDDQRLVSADDKGFVRVWRKENNKWKAIHTHRAHSKSISTIFVNDTLTLITGSSDSTVKIWKISDALDSIQETQSIDLSRRYPLSVDLSHFPDSLASILAIASTDRAIQIWTRSEDKFVQSAVLSGHEDWVRSVAFRRLSHDENTLVLASGSQDGTIRLWNICEHKASTGASTSQAQDGVGKREDELLDAFEASLGDIGDADEGGRQISLKRHIVTVKSDKGGFVRYSITFDALLIGHEAGITSLAWRPLNPTIADTLPTLLSTSTDSSLILWSPSTVLTSISTADGDKNTTSTYLWINRQRFGDVGGQRLGGFVGGLWTRGGRDALAWGWSGGFRRWSCSSGQASAGTGTSHDDVWEEIGAITGHHGPVKSIDWSPDGEYLISASLDQTTRISGEIKRTNDNDGSAVYSWHELGRPQVHGYDLQGVRFLDAQKFASVADEKVMRVFEAPRAFIELVRHLGAANLETADNTRAFSASVPPLGLSNKAITDSQQESNNESLSHLISDVKRWPFEGELSAITLWPEIEKVFGHGYELISMAVSSSRKLLATACKATSEEHAVVRLHDTERFQPYGLPLAGHNLTVTGIAFSPDDRYVLTVSRDRAWRLYGLRGDGYEPVAADKSHGRIIWDCSWAPDSSSFATASRDKTVRIWHQESPGESKKWTAKTVVKTPEAATAVAFDQNAGRADGDEQRLAIGLETGEILLYTKGAGIGNEWQQLTTLKTDIAHVDHIHCLSWRPRQSSSSTLWELASCSEDGTVKIITIDNTQKAA